MPELGSCAASGRDEGGGLSGLVALRRERPGPGRLHCVWVLEPAASKSRVAHHLDPTTVTPPPLSTQALRDIDAMLMGMGLEEPDEGEEGEEGEAAAAREAAALRLGPQPRPAGADAPVRARGAPELD